MNKAKTLLSRHEKVELFLAPTALEPLPRLSKLLGGPQIYIKRDDCTGLALGGNKTRKLEYVLADAISKNADVLITNGAPQSNHARQTAAAAARAGMECDLLLAPFDDGVSGPLVESGNLLLDKLLGARIHKQRDDGDLAQGMLEIAEKHQQEGRTPYIIDVGASSPLGSLGYVSCATELNDQAIAMEIEFDCIVLATGSCGTQAGLLSGLHLLGSGTRVMGIAVSPDGDQAFRLGRIAELVSELLEPAGGNLSLDESRISVNGDYCGSAYGVPNQPTLEAIELLARNESILLDPVYTGKAMAGLIDLIRRGYFANDETVLFLHTGGTAALFAYYDIFTS